MNEQRETEEAASEEGLSVQYTLEPDDMRAFVAFNRKHSPQMKRPRFLLALAGVGLGINHALVRYHRPSEQIVGFFSYVVLYVGLVWVVLKLVQWFTQRRMFTASQQPGLFCNHKITLFDDALFEETPVNRGEHRWAGIQNVTEASRHIFIYIGPNAAHVIPKRAFADTATERAFFERAQALHRRARQD